MTLQLTDVQKATVKAITSIHETDQISSPKGYANVTLLAGDSGHLTFGLCQTTLSSGNLYLLIKAYSSASGKYSDQMVPYLSRLKSCDLSLDDDSDFKSLLHQAGLTDPIMQETQRIFFDKIYYQPAYTAANRQNVTTALGMAIVFDGFIQGSFKRIKDLTDADYSGADEKTWFTQYVNKRKTWLTNKSVLLSYTVYRMDTFIALIKNNNWDLNLPLVAHGVTITEAKLNLPSATTTTPTQNTDTSSTPPVEDTPSNTGKITVATKTGEDDALMFGAAGGAVRALQIALVNLGYSITVNGNFDDDTLSAVETYQNAKGLTADGIVGNVTKSSLGLI